MIEEEYTELNFREYEIESRLEKFFDGDTNPNYGDGNYQDLLNQLSAVRERMNEILDILNL